MLSADGKKIEAPYALSGWGLGGLSVWGSVVSSASGVLCGAPAANDFSRYWT